MGDEVKVNRQAKIMVIEKGQLSIIGEYTVKNEIVCITNPRMSIAVEDPQTKQRRVVFAPIPYNPRELFIRSPEVWYQPERAMIDAYFENTSGIAVIRNPLVGPNGDTMQ